MVDVAATLQTPYYIFNTLENCDKMSGRKLKVPFFTNKVIISDYIKEKHPNLKAIFVEPAYYMQNWTGFSKTQKLDDNTVVFAVPMDQKAKLHLVDVGNTGPVIREILNEPEKFVGQDVCICGEAIALEDLPKVFTKVTGVLAILETLTEEEFRSALEQIHISQFVQDVLFNMYKWFAEYGAYGKDKDWTTGQKLTKLNTFEQWLKKTGWKGN